MRTAKSNLNLPEYYIKREKLQKVRGGIIFRYYDNNLNVICDFPYYLKIQHLIKFLIKINMVRRSFIVIRRK